MNELTDVEAMPGWYVELADTARDEGAPEAVRLAAAAAIQYVDDLRREHKLMRRRICDIIHGELPDNMTPQDAAGYILTGEVAP